MKTTVLVFMAGDNNLDVSGVEDLQEMVQIPASENLNLVIQFDRRKALPWEDAKERGTKRYLVHDQQLKELKDLGETNTGDPQVLQDFLSWGMKNYPAERHFTILWNHGGGIKDLDIYKGIQPKIKSSLFVPKKERSSSLNLNKNDLSKWKDLDDLLGVSHRMICTDDTSRDFLDNLELKNALSLEQGKIAILGFDACLMNLLEMGYQLKDKAEYIIGSQEIEPPQGWPYKKIFSHLARNPNLSLTDLCTIVVDEYIDSFEDKSITQSVLKTSSLVDCCEKVDQLAEFLIEHYAQFEPLLRKIFSHVQRFREGDYFDLGDFCQLLIKNVKDLKLQQKVMQLQESLSQTVLYSQTKGEKVQHAHGVCLYFPLKKPEQEMIRIYKDLDFTQKYRHWFRLIRKYFSSSQLSR